MSRQLVDRKFIFQFSFVRKNSARLWIRKVDKRMSEILNTSGTEFADFEMPSLQCNDDGWGPCELSDTFRDMPYQPFSKSDRMGKVTDWTNNATVDKKFPSNVLKIIFIYFFC